MNQGTIRIGSDILILFFPRSPTAEISHHLKLLENPKLLQVKSFYLYFYDSTDSGTQQDNSFQWLKRLETVSSTASH